MATKWQTRATQIFAAVVGSSNQFLNLQELSDLHRAAGTSLETVIQRAKMRRDDLEENSQSLKTEAEAEQNEAQTEYEMAIAAAREVYEGRMVTVREKVGQAKAALDEAVVITRLLRNFE